MERFIELANRPVKTWQLWVVIALVLKILVHHFGWRVLL
jgi:hypothetical protein